MDKLTEEIAAELTLDMIQDGIWRTLAEQIGIANLIKLMETVNGDILYVPKLDRLLIPARDAKIRKEFSGYNHAELARRYGLSTAYVRELCGPGHLENQCTISDYLQAGSKE